MKKYEVIFLSAAGIGAAIIEISIMYDAQVCVFPPVMLILLYIGLKVFPNKPKNRAEQE